MFDWSDAITAMVALAGSTGLVAWYRARTERFVALESAKLQRMAQENDQMRGAVADLRQAVEAMEARETQLDARLYARLGELDAIRARNSALAARGAELVIGNAELAEETEKLRAVVARLEAEDQAQGGTRE